MLNRLLLFVMAACLGTLFLKMELPIPYLLGGIFAAVACKIAGSPVTLSLIHISEPTRH